MRRLLGFAGVVVGAAGAALVFRAHQEARARGITLVDALIGLPILLRRDLGTVGEDARLALADGRRAAGERRAELETELRLLGR